MPYKSMLQQKFFNSKGAKKAGISPDVVSEFNKESKGLKLPEKSSPWIKMDKKNKDEK